MDRLRCLEIFAEVARGGSFSAAAQRFAISRSAVSKHVAWLEHALGAQLLARTTKEVGLTDAGHLLLESGVPLLERYEEIQAEVRDAVSTPRGVIRIGTPPSFGVHHLLPLVLQFTERHPDIQIAIETDDGRASLVAERLDLSLRIAPALDDASYIAQSLLRVPQVLVASPDYLQRVGTPRTVSELARHDCLVHTLKSPTAFWRFGEPGHETTVRVGGPLRASLGEALMHAALAGRGLSIHPTYMVAGHLAAGRLVSVLGETPPTGLDIYVIYPARNNLPRRVRAFIDFLREWAATPPDWSASVAAAQNDTR
ncbi:LysR family transcriptional regulator [Piscinibacter sakaiensis]|uniref:LysR family transcriptional regulator n=1 Tax=Piscinibacter sakaiensis TaxID=1547922 RepID=UPI003AAB60CA